MIVILFWSICLFVVGKTMIFLGALNDLLLAEEVWLDVDGRL